MRQRPAKKKWFLRVLIAKCQSVYRFPNKTNKNTRKRVREKKKKPKQTIQLNS